MGKKNVDNLLLSFHFVETVSRQLLMLQKYIVLYSNMIYKFSKVFIFVVINIVRHDDIRKAVDKGRLYHRPQCLKNYVSIMILNLW